MFSKGFFQRVIKSRELCGIELPLYHTIPTFNDPNIGWLVVLGFNATLTAKRGSRSCICVSWLSHTSTNTTFLSKATDYLLFSHASAEVEGENMPERKVASTGDRTHNHQVMSPAHSPLSHLGQQRSLLKTLCNKEQMLVTSILSHNVFYPLHNGF